MTDHRVKLTKGDVERVLAGELDDFTASARGRREAPRARGHGGVLTRRQDALGAAVPALAAAGCDTPRLDAEVLVADALGVDRAALVADPDRAAAAAAPRG